MKALIKKNFKYYWIFPVVLTLMYALFIFMPTAISEDGVQQASFANQILSEMMHPVYLGSLAIFPLMVVAVLFIHCFRPAHNTMIISFPYTKNTLFTANIISGYIFCVIPVIVLTLLFSIGTYQSPDINNGAVINTLPNLMFFLIRALVQFSLAYAFCILAATLTGNPLTYVLVTGLMVFFFQILWLIYMMYAKCFYFGYFPQMEKFLLLSAFTNPLFALGVASYKEVSISTISIFILYILVHLVYVIEAAVLLLLARYFHSVRKSERTGEAIVFKPLKIFFIYFLSFDIMVAFGFFSISIAHDERTALYLGMAGGGIIGYFICLMVAEGTIRVFHRFKGLGIMAGLAVLLVCFFQFDVTGYVNYVPKTSDYQNAYIELNSGMWNGNDNGFRDNSKEIVFSDELKREFEAFHKEIINETQPRLYGLQRYNQPMGLDTYWLRIHYTTTSGFGVVREYLLPYEQLLNSEHAKNILESTEYSTAFLTNLIQFVENPNDFQKTLTLQVTPPGLAVNGSDSAIYMNDREEINRFLKLYIADLMDEDIETILSFNNQKDKYLYEMEGWIYIDSPKPIYPYDNRYLFSKSYRIKTGNKRTIEYLKERK